MSGYIYILLVTSVCGAVCSVMAWGGFERYIKYIASLICVLVMILPFREIDISQLDISSDFSVESTSQEDLHYQTAAQMTEASAESYIGEIVFNKFGINAVGVDIKIDWEQENPIIENVSVALSESDTEKSKEVKNYLTEILGGEVNIIEG